MPPNSRKGFVMVLISQPNSLPTSGLQEYSLIILLARVDEAISVETVKNLFECGAEVSISMLTKQADDMELAFSIGTLVGENGGADNVTISLGSIPAKDMLKRMGMEKSLFGTAKRSATTKRAANRATKPKSNEMFATAASAELAQPAKEKTTTSRKSPASKLPASFLKILKECSIEKEYADGVAKAVQESAESISYELRLQLNIMDRAVSADIYSKTKGRYAELKALV